MTRVDLHLHSRHTSRVGEWALRKAGVAPSYCEPQALYDALQKKGFPLFTLTDHQTIAGCLELEGLPGVFLSEKLTALFPEDRVPVDLLVWGIARKQHEDLLALCPNIYELQAYLSAQNLAHAVAHPFHSTEGRLLAPHIGKLLLLFKHFEALNGMRAPILHEFTREFLGGLTPAKLEALANRHGLAPTHERAWEKVLTGGSGDASGIFSGRAWTEVGETANVDQFLEYLRQGRCCTGGAAGGPLTAAHGMYKRLSVAVGERFESVRSSALVKHALSRFMEGRDPTSLNWTEKLQIAADGLLSGKVFELLKPSNASLWKAMSAASDGRSLADSLEGRLSQFENPEERAFKMANLFVGRLAFQFVQSFVRQVVEGNPVQAIQDLSALVPLLGTLAPYFLELKRESPRRHWLKSVHESIHGAPSPVLKRDKVAWFTDTLEDVNGVSMTIRTLATAGVNAGFNVVVLSSKAGSNLNGVPVRNFEPIGEFALPEYELQKVAFPPVLEMVEYLARENCTSVLVSTPGPMGLAGLLGAKLLGLPVRGIYHTDFPRYVGILTQDAAMESLTWSYMHWFYTGLDTLYVNSEPYKQAWVARGAAPSLIKILPRGVDTELFNPGKKKPNFWQERGARRGCPVMLYVGRVSKEKDLEMLPALMRDFKPTEVVLAVVGDGPYLEELQTLLPDTIFTGYLSGETLACAYASADFFVFPSTTDTYGNVVVEALASGLPCVVSDVGGPAGLVQHGRTGFIVRAREQKDLSEKVRTLVDDPARLGTMQAFVSNNSLAATWESAARKFFEELDARPIE